MSKDSDETVHLTDDSVVLSSKDEGLEYSVDSSKIQQRRPEPEAEPGDFAEADVDSTLHLADKEEQEEEVTK